MVNGAIEQDGQGSAKGSGPRSGQTRADNLDLGAGLGEGGFLTHDGQMSIQRGGEKE